MSHQSLACAALAAGFSLFVSRAPAEDDAEAKARLATMRDAVAALEGSSDRLKPKALTAPAEPLLRYSDATRVPNVLVDAGVWRLGTQGRPTALVTVEFYRRANGQRVLSFEFLSLSATRFALKHKTEDIAWDATASGLDLKPLPDAPKPAANAAQRLGQMRQLARRFGANLTVNKDAVECRLIAQPIDRYSSDADKITDGAIFALANGTNPEIGVVLEAVGDGWQYGAIRLCGGEAKVTLDGKAVAAFERFEAGSRKDGEYANGWKIELGK